MKPLLTPLDVAEWLEGLDDDDEAIPPRVAERRAELETSGSLELVPWICALKPFEMTAKDAAALLRERLAKQEKP